MNLTDQLEFNTDRTYYYPFSSCPIYGVDDDPLNDIDGDVICADE